MPAFRARSFLSLLALFAMLSVSACTDTDNGSMSGGMSTGVTEECVGKVKEFPWGIKKLDCEHMCADGSKCGWQSSTDGKGAKREWCGCSSTEPDNCHLYIETPKDDSPRDDCTGSCAKGEECVKKTKKNGDVTDVSCECVKKKAKTKTRSGSSKAPSDAMKQ